MRNFWHHSNQNNESFSTVYKTRQNSYRLPSNHQSYAKVQHFATSSRQVFTHNTSHPLDLIGQIFLVHRYIRPTSITDRIFIKIHGTRMGLIRNSFQPGGCKFACFCILWCFMTGWPRKSEINIYSCLCYLLLFRIPNNQNICGGSLTSACTGTPKSLRFFRGSATSWPNWTKFDTLTKGNKFQLLAKFRVSAFCSGWGIVL